MHRLQPLDYWLTLREKRRLRVFENRALRKIFVPKKDGVDKGVEKTI